MKYSDLPKFDSLMKLIQVSFSTPKKNLMMYRLFTSLKDHITYVENEKAKLLRKYGTDEGNGMFHLERENYIAYSKEWNELLDMEIEVELPKADFTEEDFEDANCSYPADKNQWPSASDIITLTEFCEKLNKEKSGA